MLYDEKESGITLIALVITVIVLIILASVAMSLVTGQNGLFARANHAANLYQGASIKENSMFTEMDNYMTQYIGDMTLVSDLEKLQEYFGKGPDVFYWYDDATDTGGYNDVAPINDASTSIIPFDSKNGLMGIMYKGNKYAVTENLQVYKCGDYSSVDPIGEAVDEDLNWVLVTPSTPEHFIHANYQTEHSWTDYSNCYLAFDERLFEVL